MSRRRPRSAATRDAPAPVVPAPTAPVITVLADEMLGTSATLPLSKFPHVRIQHVSEIGAGWSDDDVAAYANVHHALIATINVRHFMRIIARRPHGNVNALRNAGLIALRCASVEVGRRLPAVWDFVVSEWHRAQSQRDKRVIVEIGPDYAKTFR